MFVHSSAVFEFLNIVYSSLQYSIQNSHRTAHCFISGAHQLLSRAIKTLSEIKQYSICNYSNLFD